MKFDLKELEALMTGFWLTDLANFSAYVYQNLPDINWVGFYLSDGEKLRLGPFMGKPACTEIKFGKGVCGTAFAEKKSLLVDDVDAFPGHIRCDSASKSEIVIPFYVNKKLIGVLDVDSPTQSRFSKDDLVMMENSLAILSYQLQTFPQLEAL